MILDTNALSAFADDAPGVLQQIADANELCVPVVVLGEYRFGIAASRHRLEYEAWLARGRAFWRVLPIVDETASCYARIRQELKKAGTPIPVNDAWIAALAREHDLAVLSRDAHFDEVSGLKRLAW